MASNPCFDRHHTHTHTSRFKPGPNDIKKRIEALIEQEYLARDPNERGKYNYMA